MPSSKPQRWLDLLAVLIGHRLPVSIDQIMERVPAYRERLERDGAQRETVRRMFERDKDELRRLGIPLETRRCSGEGMTATDGYLILRRNFYLPYLELLSRAQPEVDSGGHPSIGGPHAVGRVTLAESDAQTAVRALRKVIDLPSFPFRQEAKTALRKLTFDLDPALDPGSDPSIRILDRRGGADPHGVLKVVLDGMYDRRRLAFRYHSIGRDAVESRELEPWGLLFQWGAWYLLAHDPSREGAPDSVRLFRTDRMSEARPVRAGQGTPDFTVPDSFDIRSFAGRRAWEMGAEDAPELEAIVRFRPSASPLADRNGWGDPVVEEADTDEGNGTANGSVLRRFRVRRLDPFLRWILSLAGEAEVLDPPPAVEQLTAMAREIEALYREDHPGGLPGRTIREDHPKGPPMRTHP